MLPWQPGNLPKSLALGNGFTVTRASPDSSAGQYRSCDTRTVVNFIEISMKIQPDGSKYSCEGMIRSVGVPNLSFG
jgi:hypothetical protein